MEGQKASPSGLWRRHFFHVDPGHWMVARGRVSTLVASTHTLTDPESHPNSALAEFLTDSFDVTYAVWISCKFNVIPHNKYAINGWRGRLSTLHHWRWNTTDCNSWGSHRRGNRHSKRHATPFCRMFSWKYIPVEKLKAAILLRYHDLSRFACKHSFFEDPRFYRTSWRPCCCSKPILWNL